MESKVSTSAINEISSLLRHEINDMHNTYTSIVDEINFLINNINALKECDGAGASSVNMGVLNSAELLNNTINNKKEIWKINVTGDERVREFLFSNAHAEIMSNLEKMILEPRQINDVADQIDKYIKSIGSSLENGKSLKSLTSSMDHIDII